MRVFRRRKKPYDSYGVPGDGIDVSDLAYQMAAEQAARFVAHHPMPEYAYDLYNHYEREEEPIYDPAEFGAGDRVRASSPFNFISSALGRGRSSSRERYSESSRRVGSPAHYHSRSGSPMYIQPSASSPLQYVIRERNSSPHSFVPITRSSSSDIARRLQRAQLSQDLQYMEKQQRRQDQMEMAYSDQYDPYYSYYQQAQQPNYFMQQPQMYSYY